MNALIVYDSKYGNTEKIARAIGEAIPGARARAHEVDSSMLELGDLLIVGSPTYGGRSMSTVQTFLRKMPTAVVKGIKAASFDTQSRAPEGFIVEDTKGPLKPGELEWAESWAGEILRNV